METLEPGLRLRVKTTFKEELDGILFAVDTAANCMVLQELGATRQLEASKFNFRVIKLNHIEDANVVAQSDDAKTILAPVRPSGAVSMERLQKRERNAVQQIESNLRRIGTL
jgi:hypothetical protein